MKEKNITILAADDDYEDLELIEDAIIGLDPDAKIYRVDNGRAVIDYLNNLQDKKLPDLIVLDYNMPELNGAQVLSEIGHDLRYKSIPKIILSTSGAPLHKDECMYKGATEYFVKPNNLADLEKLAGRMLKYCKAS